MADTLQTVTTRFAAAEENQRPKFEKFSDFDYIFHSRLKKADPNIPSKVFNPIVWSFIETIVTRMLAKNPEVQFKPREYSDQVQAEILSDLFDYWFDKAKAYPVTVNWVKDALIYGTGIIKVDWFSSPLRMVKQYQIDETGEAAIDPETGTYIVSETPVRDYDDPRVQNVNIYDFFVDPSATTIENAKWVIHQYNTTIDDLENRVNQAKKYGNVSFSSAALAKLKKAIAGAKVTDSQFEQNRRDAAGLNPSSNISDGSDKVKVWEMWEDNRCVLVANEAFVLYDSENPNWHGQKPFVRIVDSLVPNEFWGKGEIEPIEKMIHALNTTQNQRITNVNRILSPMWKATDQVDDDELQFIDNGIIHVTRQDDVDIIVPDNVTATAVQEGQVLTEAMQRALGVTDYTQGLSTPGQTAKEVEIKTSQSNARFAHKVQLLEQMGLSKLGELVYKLYQQYITRSKVIRVTGDKGTLYKTVGPADLVGNYDVIPESGSTLEVDQNESFTKYMQLFQILLPFVQKTQVDPMTGQQVTTGYIDEKELVKELLDQSGMKDKERLFKDQGVPNEPGTAPTPSGPQPPLAGPSPQGQGPASPISQLLPTG
jgi:hypothetical protein